MNFVVTILLRLYYFSQTLQQLYKTTTTTTHNQRKETKINLVNANLPNIFAVTITTSETVATLKKMLQVLGLRKMLPNAQTLR